MIKIQSLSPNDKLPWKVLWQQYLEFYQTDLAEDITNTTWQRLIDASNTMQIGLGAYYADRLIGFVTILYHNGTWAVEPYCYLEDLFILKDFRGQGVARNLIEAVFEHAKNQGASQVYWTTQEGNDTARKLYDQVASLTDFVKYKAAI